jgi:hypothetical protein
MRAVGNVRAVGSTRAVGSMREGGTMRAVGIVRTGLIVRAIGCCPVTLVRPFARKERPKECAKQSKRRKNR